MKNELNFPIGERGVYSRERQLHLRRAGVAALTTLASIAITTSVDNYEAVSVVPALFTVVELVLAADAGER